MKWTTVHTRVRSICSKFTDILTAHTFTCNKLINQVAHYQCMGVNKVLSGQTKTNRETGKREKKREEKKEWQPFTQTWYTCFHYRKKHGTVFRTQRFCQAKVFYKAIKNK